MHLISRQDLKRRVKAQNYSVVPAPALPITV